METAGTRRVAEADDTFPSLSIYLPCRFPLEWLTKDLSLSLEQAEVVFMDKLVFVFILNVRDQRCMLYTCVS